MALRSCLQMLGLRQNINKQIETKNISLAISDDTSFLSNIIQLVKDSSLPRCFVIVSSQNPHSMLLPQILNSLKQLCEVFSGTKQKQNKLYFTTPAGSKATATLLAHQFLQGSREWVKTKHQSQSLKATSWLCLAIVLPFWKFQN